MKIDWKGLLEGTLNQITANKLAKEIADKRYEICRTCKFNSSNAKRDEGYSTLRFDEHCVDCGCTLSRKTLCLSCACPKGFWVAEITKEEEEKIKTNA